MRTYQMQYYMPTRTYFGDGAIEHLNEALAPYGKKILMIYGKHSAKSCGVYDTITEMFRKEGYEWYEYCDVTPNPHLDSAIEAANICKQHGVNAIIAIGGGSIIDCSKAASWIALYDGEDPWVMTARRGQIKEALPLIAIPTLAAAGSEMDSGAIITNTKLKVKAGFGSDALYPNVAIIDPKYSYGAPRRQVAAGCADIFTHVIENYFSPDEDLYFADCMIEGVMKTVVKYAPVALSDPDNFEARANISWAAPWAMSGLMMGGRSTAPTLHPLQHPLGAFHDITHGEGLAILMPHWFRFILSEKTVNRFVKLGVNVFGIDASLDRFEIAEKTIAAVEDLFFNQFGIPRKLSDLGVTEEHFEEMAKQVGPVRNAMAVPLSEEDIVAIYKAAL